METSIFLIYALPIYYFLYAHLDRDVNSGARALALLKHIFRERNPGIVDLRETGTILAAVKVTKLVTPQSFLQRILELGRSKKGMNEDINWQAAGLELVKDKDDAWIPKVLSDNILSNLALLDFASDRMDTPLCRDVSQVLTEDVLAKARNMEYTMGEVQELFDLLDSKKIVHTPPKPADYVQPDDLGISPSMSPLASLL